MPVNDIKYHFHLVRELNFIFFQSFLPLNQLVCYNFITLLNHTDCLIVMYRQLKGKPLEREVD